LNADRAPQLQASVMSLLRDSMMERVEEKSNGSVWQLLGPLILFHVISGALKGWLMESIAVGTAAFAVALICYRFSPYRKVGFLKWTFGSLLIVVGYVGLIYGVFFPLRNQLGAVLAAGLMVFVLVMSFRFVPDFFLGQKAKDGFWKWLAISAGVGLLFAFFAYINPEGFWKP
jgi:hypothetical protein